MVDFDYQKQPGRKRVRFFVPDPKTALVSIITPFYNAGKYFEQTFNSVMNQTFPWFEWIIVNDGSSKQEEVDLLYRLAGTDRRILVITQENAGPSVARNRAIEHSHTDLIVPLDADDLIDPTYLECLYWSLKYNPNAAWSYSNSYGFQELEYTWNYPFSAKKLKTYNFLNYTGMIRKKDIEDIGGYKDEKQAYHEDWRFWLDMLSMSKKPVRVASHLFWYRRLGTGRMSSVNKDKTLSENGNRIIEKAASTVDVRVKALEYPVKWPQNVNCATKKGRWNSVTNSTSKGKRLLWLMPWMEAGQANAFHLEVMEELKRIGFEQFVLATKSSEKEWRQKFEEYTDEIFVLSDFLAPMYHLEFIDQFIQSRHVDGIIITNINECDDSLSWIREYYPEIPVVFFTTKSKEKTILSEKTCHVTDMSDQDTIVQFAEELRRFMREPEVFFVKVCGLERVAMAEKQRRYLRKLKRMFRK